MSYAVLHRNNGRLGERSPALLASLEDRLEDPMARIELSVANGPVIASGPEMIKPVIAGKTDIENTSRAATFDPPISPTLAQEVSYINGLNPDNTITGTSFWGSRGQTAFKYGSSTAGTGATISYSFDPSSSFTDQEKNTMLVGFAEWEAVANVTFVESDETPTGIANSDLLLHRGSDGGAYTTNNQTAGSGSTLGHASGQVTISIDTSVFGFDLSGSFVTAGGYGQSTIIHELGHFLGLGHGGGYNGDVDPSTQQFSAFDERQWTIMSYIFFADTNAKYEASYTNPDTYWGITDDGIYRQAPHSVQMLDILAMQQLYGAAVDTPFSGGQIYGFNSNITGVLHDTFDFSVNTQPVVTLFNEGTGNELDLSGYTAAERVDLHGGTFSDVGGLYNNVSIAFGTMIDMVVTGDGNDTLVANDDGDMLVAGNGNDTLVGGAGDDYLDGRGDTDTVSYAAATAGVTVSLLNQGVSQNTIGAGEDTLTNVENLTGSAYADTLTGDSGANVLDGAAGADVMRGGGGNDTYYVDDSSDQVIEAASGGTDVVFSSASFGLAAGSSVETLSLTGAGNIDATGNSFANTLVGNDGNNVLDGGAGADRMTGGLGDDTYYVDTVGDVVKELSGQGNDQVFASVSYSLAAQFIETLTLTGSSDIDATGNNLANTLTGNGGSNVLNGETGADTMAGGLGDDTYYVDNAGDVVIEANGEGNDQIFSSVSYSLHDQFIETLTLTGKGNIDATGNSQANTLVGNSGNNTLDGSYGEDTASFATATGSVNANLVSGTATGAGTDTLISIEDLTGSAFADRLTGNAGTNTLDGGGGADILTGGDGNDTYYVDNSADKVVETSTGGNDLVFSSATFSLAGQFIETLTLTGSTNINATGNSQNNTINGNAGNNIIDGLGGADRMAGGLGDDTYYVDNIGDFVTEAASGGSDTVFSSVSYSLASQFIETLNLTGTGNVNGTGNSQSNTINGNAGSNVIDGGKGIDTMAGGKGDDTYYVDTVGDTVTEASGEGNDQVFSSVSFSLSSQYIEKLTLTGTAAINGSGNTQINTLIGNGAANLLDGGAGSDALTGGGGADTFRFSTALGSTNIDSITDFTVGADLIALDKKIFKAFTTDGALAGGAFFSGTTAHDADDRIIYNGGTGDLFYDADGIGAGAAIKFATISTGLSLTASSFSIVG